MNYLELNYPGFDCDESGNVYKDGKIIKPFKSNKYLQVCIFDNNHKKRVVGAHTVIAMKYLDYFEGCVVHHKDENPHNNALYNLEVQAREEHTSFHSKKLGIGYVNLGKPAWNRGMKMSEDFCRHCSEAAKRRWSKFKETQGRSEQVDTGGFDPSEVGALPTASA